MPALMVRATAFFQGLIELSMPFIALGTRLIEGSFIRSTWGRIIVKISSYKKN